MTLDRSTVRSLREYGRGVAGALVFSLPLLYTMEMWEAGVALSVQRQLVFAIGTYVLLLGYNRFVGLHPESSWREVAIDSVEEMGIGLVLAALILLVVGQIGLEESPDEILGKVVVEGMAAAIGVSVGTAQLGSDDADRDPKRGPAGIGGQLALAVCGAVLFAANVAPTEEIPRVAADADESQLIGIVGISLAIGAVVLYFSDFAGSARHAGRRRFGPIEGTVMTYAVALVCSAAALWLFGRLDGADPYDAVAQTVVLGFPATLGASAGRLLLQ